MKHYLLLWLMIAASLISSCMPQNIPLDDPDAPVSSIDTPVPTRPASSVEFEYDEAAYIDSIDPLFLESFPLQVHALITGNLPDGCTEIQRHEVKREENTFFIKVFTQRPVGSFCTEALVPFEYSVPLDVYGLPAGTYHIKAYKTAAEFKFDQDNISQSSGGG